jgi:hypothetical protein
LRNEEHDTYKFCDAASMQEAPPPPINRYLSDSTVGSDDEAPTARRAPCKVTAPLRMQQATRKISATPAATMIAVTQTAEAKKKKRKWTRPTMSVDTTMVSSGVETIEVDNDEVDAVSLSATTAPSTGTSRRVVSTEEHAVETPRRMSAADEHPRSSTDTVGDLGSNKRARKAPPKTCKPGLRSATK